MQETPHLCALGAGLALNTKGSSGGGATATCTEGLCGQSRAGQQQHCVAQAWLVLNFWQHLRVLSSFGSSFPPQATSLRLCPVTL